MPKIAGITLIIFFIVNLQGCKWREDFRRSPQSQYQDPMIGDSLDYDSSEYANSRSELINNNKEGEASLPAIDQLSPIPIVPDHPAEIK